jgi:hypothetical protein
MGIFVPLMVVGQINMMRGRPQREGVVTLISSLQGSAMFPYESDGVDVSLIRWMLSLTPCERLQTLQDFVDAVDDVLRKNLDAQLPGGSPNVG